MNLPNFFIIGAAKSGTSSLYMYLKQHPNVFMPTIKEPHYFSYTEKTKNTNGPGDKIYLAISNFEEYKQLFNPTKNQTAIGEASTSYLYRPEAATRIHEIIPDVKIIAILRHPADRAFSSYMHVVRDQREILTSFEEALKNEDNRIADGWEPIWHFKNVGYYYKQLLRYYKLFPEEHIKIYLYEDFIDNPDKIIRDIFNYLSINPDFLPDRSVKFNVSGEQKNLTIYKLSKYLFHTPNPIRWVSRRAFPHIWRTEITNWVMQKNLKTKQIPSKTKNALIDIYEEDIMHLQGLIKKDLTHWLRKNNN